MTYPRIMIAAPKSGSGKTYITCALLQALQMRGYHVGAFKSGPDYIDPMFHTTVLGIPSKIWIRFSRKRIRSENYFNLITVMIFR